MPEPISKTQRWLDLIALLLNRRIPLTVEEVMERVPAYERQWSTGEKKARESVRRMFERDKDEMRAAGIPIDSVEYQMAGDTLEGYRIARKDFYLPYLKVSGADVSIPVKGMALAELTLAPEEARTALDALRGVMDLPAFPFADEARSALGKLTFDVDPSRYPVAPVIQVERPGVREVLVRLRVLSDALLTGKRVAFRYHGIHRGEATDREVEPYGIFFQRDWYLVARDPSRDAIRLFRVSRMDEPVLNRSAPKERDFVVPTDFELRSYVGRKAWELTEEPPLAAEVLFRFPSSLLAERHHDGELVANHPDGSALRRFQVGDPEPFLRWVLGFAGEASVRGPAELRAAFADLVAKTAARYEVPDA